MIKKNVFFNQKVYNGNAQSNPYNNKLILACQLKFISINFKFFFYFQLFSIMYVLYRCILISTYWYVHNQFHLD